jgi:hypothetical protein
MKRSWLLKFAATVLITAGAFLIPSNSVAQSGPGYCIPAGQPCQWYSIYRCCGYCSWSVCR